MIPGARRTPWVTLLIMFVCSAVFLWEWVFAANDPEAVLARYWLVPDQFFKFGERDGFLVPGLYAPFVTAVFLHGDVVHLLMNMLFLALFADDIEARLGHLGFAAFFLAGGALAAAAHVVAHPDSVLPVVGASGAIAGVMGCFTVLHPAGRLTLMNRPLRVPALFVLALWLFLLFVQATVGLATEGVAASAAWWAHAGGFVYGVLVASWLRLRTRGSVPPADTASA